MKRFRYIYGPVPSWRLGRSLGVDLLCGDEKSCAFDCIYCQLGSSEKYSLRRKVYVPTRELVKEIKSLPKMAIDYITFSGRGEPTLAKNLGQAIKAVKRLRREPVAVLTGASIIYRKDVQKDLALADLVAVKLDADSEDVFQMINRPAAGIHLNKIIKGIMDFKKYYRGKLVLQTMWTEKNKDCAKGVAALTRRIGPDEVHITTPTRISASTALSRRQILAIKRCFFGLNARAIYEVRRKKVRPLNKKDTLRRRGSAG